MTKYMINSECGQMEIEANDIESAKQVYSANRHFDFDSCESIEGSWFWVSDFSTGEVLEECGEPV